METHDYKLALDFWTVEYPVMADKTRSGIIAQVMGTLHVFNTGIVREMVSGESNICPDCLLDGAWVLVNFPPSEWGAIGLFISTGWKYLTEIAILKRKATEHSPFVTIWADEYAQFCNRFDAEFICQCRSHKGCLVALLQSVASIYAAMPGEAGKHFADALLANFSHAVIHASDPVTAKWAASKLGRVRHLLCQGGYQPRQQDNLWQDVFGVAQVSASYSEAFEQVLQDQEFMVGRTGGPDNDFEADAIVIRSGEPFADGNSYLYRAFSQR
jgi:hypothetical protein